MSDDLVTSVPEIAAALGLSTKAIYKMAKTGQGPVQQLGGRGKVYSRRAWIAKYVAGEPGFWKALPQEEKPLHANPFLVRVGDYKRSE